MRANYEINIRDVDYRKYEKFREVLAENGFALAGKFSKVRGIQSDIYEIGLDIFLKSPNKILKKWKNK
jgi:hypothetical protein